MIHSLIPFTQLCRRGVPSSFRVIRIPLCLDGAEIAVGGVVGPDSFPNRIRLRQMYEQRRIEPVDAPKNSRQLARERMQVRAHEAAQPDLASDIPAPILSLPFSAPEVHAVEESNPQPQRNPKVAYRPRRGVRP